jgi:hypothetical protein
LSCVWFGVAPRTDAIKTYISKRLDSVLKF